MAWRNVGALALLFSCAFGQLSYGLEVDPGDYEQFPVNSTLAVQYYQHDSDRGLYSHGQNVVPNANLYADVGISRLLHVLEIAPGVTFAPQFLLPYGQISPAGVLSSAGQTGGLGDLILAFPIKVTLNTKYSDVFAVTGYVTLPTGAYDPSRTINLGTNQYQGIIQSAYVHHFDKQWSLDLVGDIAFYSDNNKFNNGAAIGTLSEDPRYELQSYLRYKVLPNIELAGGVGAVLGAGESFQGQKLNNAYQTEYGRLSIAYNPEPTVQVFAELGRDLHVENGLKTNTFFELRLVKAFLQ